MKRVTIEFSDGRYFWRELPDWEGLPVPEWVGPFAEVPESTLRLWEAVERLNAEVQVQLRALDTATWVSAELTAPEPPDPDPAF